MWDHSPSDNRARLNYFFFDAAVVSFLGANQSFIKQHAKVNLMILCSVASGFCYWLLGDPVLDFSGTTFFDTLNIRFVFFAKAIIAIFSYWPIGIGVDGCLTVISTLDIKHLVALVQEHVVFAPHQIRQLNFYADALPAGVSQRTTYS